MRRKGEVDSPFLRGKGRKMKNKSSKLPYLFLSPVVLMLLVFSYLPMPYALYLSFNKINPSTGKYEFVGLQNWRQTLLDGKFWESACNTLWYVIIFTAIMIVLGLITAMILNAKVPGTSFYLTVLFVPWVISEVIVGATWKWLLNPDFGVLNYLLGPLGIKCSNLIAKPEFALVGVALVAVWRGLAYTVILMLAGLQNVSNDYLEAASLDGCSRWQSFWRVTLPVFSPTLLVVTLLNIINAISQSGIILVLTKGGPVRATETLALYLYKEAFLNYQMSGAATMSIVLAFINMIVVVVYLAAKRRGEEAAL